MESYLWSIFWNIDIIHGKYEDQATRNLKLEPYACEAEAQPLRHKPSKFHDSVQKKRYCNNIFWHNQPILDIVVIMQVYLRRRPVKIKK